MKVKITYMRPTLSVAYFSGENITAAATHASGTPEELKKIGAYAGNISFNQIIAQNEQMTSILEFH